MKREYPAGPKISFPLAIARQMLPQIFAFDWLAFALDVSRRYGDIAHHRLGPLHVYLLNSPESIRQVLVEEREKFNKARFLKRGFGPFVGNGLFTSDGELWRRQRKLMQPTFRHDKLGRYGEITVTHALRLMDSFRDGEVREINADMMNLTLGVVVKSLFGAEIKSGRNDIGALMMAVLDASNQRLNSAVQVPSWVPTRRNLRERRAVARIEALLRTLTEERRTDAEPRDDLLATLLQLWMKKATPRCPISSFATK